MQRGRGQGVVVLTEGGGYLRAGEACVDRRGLLFVWRGACVDRGLAQGERMVCAPVGRGLLFARRGACGV